MRAVSPAGGPATIYDVAALSGVAVSTVSRALSSSGRISARTRERVTAVASQLQYVPSREARALSSGRTGTVAVLVPDLSQAGCLGLIRSIHHGLKAAGYAQLLVDTELKAGVESQSLSQLRKSVDGVILAGSMLADEDLLAAASNGPLVVIGRDVPGLAAVLFDPGPAINHALDQLVLAGHTRIAYVSYNGPAVTCGTVRSEALIRAAHDRGLDVGMLGPFGDESAAEAAAAVVRVGYTACFVASDVLAFGMLRRFKAMGVRVPGDIAMMGCRGAPRC